MAKKKKKECIEEKRRVPRTALQYVFIDVFKQKVQSLTEFRGKVCDLSTLGAKFVCSRPYKKNEMVYMGLALPNRGSLVDVTGKVVRCEKKKEKYYVAVEFKEDYYQQALIRDYIKMMQVRDKYIKVTVRDDEKS